MAAILLVCTGNICRSPMAEGLLRDMLAHRFPGSDVQVSSAGIAAMDGNAPTAEAQHAALERDADISGHRARRLRIDHIQQADLVVGMAAEHVQAVRDLVPAAAPKTFTLKELVGLFEDMPPVEGSRALDDEALRARIAEIATRRATRPLDVVDLDVSDPLGMSLETYRATAWELDTLLGQLVEGLAGKLPARSSIWDED